MNNVDIICVDGVNPQASYNALNKCIKSGFKANNYFFLTPFNLSFENKTIKHIKIEPIQSLFQYSMFMIKSLYQYIESDYCLIIQHDGYILNANAWTNEFLKYDYIGAPWHNEWKKDHPDWNRDNSNDVGNGGFSLRSKRLQKFIADDTNILQVHPEDWCICKTYYKYLTNNGFKFAPTELAYKFAVDGEPWSGQFGFHSLRATDLSNFKGSI